MAHEIENMLFVGETPWHGLGKGFINAPSIKEAIVAAGLDWRVTTEPVFSGAQEKLDAQLTRRDSDKSILGVVGPSYVPLQNSEAFEIFSPWIDGKLAEIHTAGSLRQGRRVWILAKLALDPMEIVKGDAVEKYILLSHSHDGTLAVRMGFTPIRVVCANTLAQSHNSAESKLIRVKHTKNVVQNLEALREVMNTANADFEATAEQYRALANTQINAKDLEQYVKLVFNSDKKILQATDGIESMENKRLLNAVTPLFESGRGNNLPGVKGTLWAAYNGITEYLGYERGKEKETRLDQLWFGQSAQLNKRALSVAVAFAQGRKTA